MLCSCKAKTKTVCPQHSNTGRGGGGGYLGSAEWSEARHREKQGANRERWVSGSAISDLCGPRSWMRGRVHDAERAPLGQDEGGRGERERRGQDIGGSLVQRGA